MSESARHQAIRETARRLGLSVTAKRHENNRSTWYVSHCGDRVAICYGPLEAEIFLKGFEAGLDILSRYAVLDRD